MTSPTESTDSAPKENRFSKHPWLAGVIVSIIILLLLEGGSQIALWIRDKFQAQPDATPEELYLSTLKARDSIDQNLMTKEMQYLYQDNIQFHPYRWYKLPGNFRGTYIQTEGLGYRFNPEEADIQKSFMACYGGSTMFSIYTKQDGTIPSLLNSQNLLPDSIYALNMGVGAYGSSTELMSFIETSRKYPIKYALFLDGVNEVTRYLDRFMYFKDEEMYDYWNYPYSTALSYAFMNTLNSRASELEMRKKREWKPAIYWVSVSLLGKLKKLFPQAPESVSTPGSGWSESDYEKAGKMAAKIYLDNIRDIQALAEAKGIKAYFILQPSLFSTQRPLSEQEQAFIDNNHPFVSAIHKSVYKHILAADKGDLNFYDMSGAWDDMPKGDYFYDWHHVNKAGNDFLARKIAKEISLFR